MALADAKTAAEALLALAQQADAQIAEFRDLLSQIHELERDIVRELKETGDKYWRDGTGLAHSGRLHVANYAVSRVRLPQSTPSPTLSGPTVLEQASLAWAFLEPEQPSQEV